MSHSVLPGVEVEAVGKGMYLVQVVKTETFPPQWRVLLIKKESKQREVEIAKATTEVLKRRCNWEWVGKAIFCCLVAVGVKDDSGGPKQADVVMAAMNCIGQ
ncbi:hypothetical protein NC652_030393 [Populus alba x Populus x berolinensis]|nr:hypothetical protein NC652_030393 [Populus alba x Populus x berolinensis]